MLLIFSIIRGAYFPVARTLFIFVSVFQSVIKNNLYLFHLTFNSPVPLCSSAGPRWTTQPTTQPTTCWLLETIIRVSQGDAWDV